MVFHWCNKNSHIIYTIKTIKLIQYTVKLNRVFFPHYFFQVRSLGCGFKARSLETVRIALLHSCASQIERRSYYPHLSYFPSLHNLNTGQKSQSVKNKKTFKCSRTAFAKTITTIFVNSKTPPNLTYNTSRRTNFLYTSTHIQTNDVHILT